MRIAALAVVCCCLGVPVFSLEAATKVLVLGGSVPLKGEVEASFPAAEIAGNLQAILSGDGGVSLPVTVQALDTYRQCRGMAEVAVTAVVDRPGLVTASADRVFDGLVDEWSFNVAGGGSSVSMGSGAVPACGCCILRPSMRERCWISGRAAG